MGRRALVVAVLMVGVLAACGSDGDGAPETLTTTSTVAGAPAEGATSTVSGAAGGSDPAPVTPASTPSTPATTAPATTAPPTTAPASTAPTRPTGNLTAACLQGEWLLDNGTADLFYATLIPFAPLSVPSGSVSMTFDGDQVRHYTNIVLRFTVPDGFVEVPLDLLQEGTWRVEGEQLRITVTSRSGGYGAFTGEVGGVSVNVPPLPLPDMPPIAGGPASCAGDAFQLQYTSGVSDAVAYFTRAR